MRIKAVWATCFFVIFQCLTIVTFAQEDLLHNQQDKNITNEATRAEKGYQLFCFLYFELHSMAL